jgi:hypothetical protein
MKIMFTQCKKKNLKVDTSTTHILVVTITKFYLLFGETPYEYQCLVIHAYTQPYESTNAYPTPHLIKIGLQVGS